MCRRTHTRASLPPCPRRSLRIGSAISALQDHRQGPGREKSWSALLVLIPWSTTPLRAPVRFTPPASPPESGETDTKSTRTKSGSSFSTPGRPEIQSSYPPALVSLPVTLPWSGPVSACTWISGVLVVALEAQSRAPRDLQGRERRSARGRARSIGEQAGSVARRPGSSAAEQESRSSGAGEAL